jgi:hypothetical protein
MKLRSEQSEIIALRKPEKRPEKGPNPEGVEYE